MHVIFNVMSPTCAVEWMMLMRCWMCRFKYWVGTAVLRIQGRCWHFVSRRKLNRSLRALINTTRRILMNNSTRDKWVSRHFTCSMLDCSGGQVGVCNLIRIVGAVGGRGNSVLQDNDVWVWKVRMLRNSNNIRSSPPCKHTYTSSKTRDVLFMTMRCISSCQAGGPMNWRYTARTVVQPPEPSAWVCLRGPGYSF